MQPGNYLGIYLAKDHASVVCLKVEGLEKTITGCFGVSLESAPNTAGPPADQDGDKAAEGNESPSHSQQDEPQMDFDSLAQRIASGCAERQLKFDEAAVAIDCAMFMQHSVHSEFSDIKKIGQTVRFDTEEVLGADATDVAIAFKIDSSDQAGANMSVFTTPKQSFSELLTALQANNIDPASIEPDVNCLARFVGQKVSLPADGRPLFAFLSGRNGYFISPLSSPWQGISPMPAAMRTFLLSGAQNRNQTLARQISMTNALIGSAQPISRIEICDAANSVNCDDIGKKVFIQTEPIDIISSAGLSPGNLADCPDIVEFATAYGAALAFLDPPQSANWRSDFMPYQGRKLRLQNTLKYLSVAAAILMLALGVYGFMHAMQFNKYRARLHEKFAKEYSAVMFGESMPAKSKEAVRKIKVAQQRIKEAQKGAMSLTGEDAVAGKFTMVLQAFNKCASETSLNIDTVNITDKSISITGDTSGRDNTLKVFDALRKTNLNVLSQSLSSQGGRDTFIVTVEAKKQ